jgi:signal transduction histidine kinase
VAPFAIVAVLAEASLALPPGPQSGSAVVASVVLLLATAGAFLLPWPRLPAWMSVLVLLLYTGSVLALVLAAGATSGVGVVILIPLIWTALFHRPWESACVVAGIVAVEVVISLTPVAVGDDVIARRVLLWASLGALISIATHGLRDRIRRSQAERERLQDQLRERSIIEDRDRIATDLKDRVIQQIFAAGLTLQGAAALTTDPEVRRRVGASVSDLDLAVRMLRDAIFDLEERMHRRKLRQEVVDMCRDLSPPPEISFSGPVDGALHPAARARLLDVMREALGLIERQAIPARIAISADGDLCITTIDIDARADADGPGPDYSDLRDKAGTLGITVSVERNPGGTRLMWQLPVDSGLRP